MQRLCSRTQGISGSEILRSLNLAAGALRPRLWKPNARTRSRGRGSTRAEEVNRVSGTAPGGRLARSPVDSLGAGLRCDTVVAPHLSRPGVKGDPLLPTHKRPTNMSVVYGVVASEPRPEDVNSVSDRGAGSDALLTSSAPMRCRRPPTPHHPAPPASLAWRQRGPVRKTCHTHVSCHPQHFHSFFADTT